MTTELTTMTWRGHQKKSRSAWVYSVQTILIWNAN